MTPPVISPTGGWIGTTIFVLLFLAAIALFGLRVGELITLLVKARREDRTDHIDDRIGEFFLVVLGQSDVGDLPASLAADLDLIALDELTGVLEDDLVLVAPSATEHQESDRHDRSN